MQPPTPSPAAGRPPDPEEIARRARWLRSLTDVQREGLPDLPLREVERLYAHWAEEAPLRP